jgi:integrase/recombinase XerD
VDSTVDSKNASHKANLKQYRKVNDRWQFVPVAKSNGKPNPKLVIIDGEPVSSRGGTFYVEWREDGKRKQRPVGTTVREALDAWHQQCGVLAGDIEEPPESTAEATTGTTTIDRAITDYLRDVKATKGLATHRAYSTDLKWFRKHCTKHLVSRLDRNDVMHLFAVGREEGRNQKTINKRVVVMLNAMRAAEATLKLRKGDWPKTIEKKVESYQPDELTAFFAACDDEERLLFQVFLCTGFRSREVETLTWADINFSLGYIAVTPKMGFTPKSYDERQVLIPRALVDALKVRQKRSKSTLVFPNSAHPTRPNYGGDKQDAHMLELCKEIALRGCLNCGRCTGTYTVKRSATRKEKVAYSCKRDPRCANWYLHKWRHTFATNMVQSQVDIRSLQVMLGHKNIATTEKYLKSLRLTELRDKIEQSSLAAYV